MSRKVKLLDPKTAQTGQMPETRPQVTDWDRCVLCQMVTSEKLVDPLKSTKPQTDGSSGYQTIAENLKMFKELDNMSMNIRPERLDDGYGIEETLIAHKAKWHKTCYSKTDSQKLNPIQKKA